MRLLNLGDEPSLEPKDRQLKCIACSGAGKVQRLGQGSGVMRWFICDGCGGEGTVAATPKLKPGQQPLTDLVREELAAGRVQPVAPGPLSEGHMQVRIGSSLFTRAIDYVDVSASARNPSGQIRRMPMLMEGEQVVWYLGSDIPEIVQTRRPEPDPVVHAPTSWVDPSTGQRVVAAQGHHSITGRDSAGVSPTRVREGYMTVRVDGEERVRRVSTNTEFIDSVTRQSFTRQLPILAPGETVSYDTHDGVPEITTARNERSRFNSERMR